MTSTVNLPQGFRAAGVTAGLKASGRSDLALVVNDGPDHHAAAVFTSNRVEAAPVTWSRQVVSDGRVDAVILNSGGANACTGSPGFLDTHRTAEKVGEVLGVSAGDVVVCSTGLIGERLPMDLLLPGVDAVATALSVDGHDAAATAIMTTDTVSKQATFVGDGWSVSGMAKGAGMLAPGLATMLVVITTDALIDDEVADRALRGATGGSFDRLDSDGCMSTNDTVLLMASGASGVKPGWKALLEGVTRVCLDLAVQLIADAEGAHHDIEIEVRSAASEADALEVARAIARNNPASGPTPSGNKLVTSTKKTSTSATSALPRAASKRSGGVLCVLPRRPAALHRAMTISRSSALSPHTSTSQSTVASSFLRWVAEMF